MTNQVCNYDLTIMESTEHGVLPWESLDEWAEELFKYWAFQLEEGATEGYRHFQFRGSLKQKKRLHEMIAMVQSEFPTAHVSITSKQMIGNYKYCTTTDKSGKRVAGPWGNKAPIEEQSNCEGTAGYVPIRFRKQPIWSPMQQSIIDKCKTLADDRSVNCIVNPGGKMGKTFIAMFLQVHGIGTYVPQFENAKELMRLCFAMPKKGIYFIDLPRATSKSNECALYAGIEQLKAGLVYDDRYKYRQVIFEPPHVFVFTNHEPDQTMLTGDRWKIMRVQTENSPEHDAVANEICPHGNSHEYGMCLACEAEPPVLERNPYTGQLTKMITDPTHPEWVKDPKWSTVPAPDLPEDTAEKLAATIKDARASAIVDLPFDPIKEKKAFREAMEGSTRETYGYPPYTIVDYSGAHARGMRSSTSTSGDLDILSGYASHADEEHPPGRESERRVTFNDPSQVQVKPENGPYRFTL